MMKIPKKQIREAQQKAKEVKPLNHMHIEEVMKTNKITATIVVEIEDNRSEKYRATHPMNEKLIEKNINFRLNKCFVPYHFGKKVIKFININETRPLTEAQIKYHLYCVAIDDAISKFHDDYKYQKNGKLAWNAEALQKAYASGSRDLDNWNWRQDCSS